MSQLSNLPNIGEVLAAKLQQAGINNEQELKECGSEKAIIKLATITNNDVCICSLYAIEGAIQGIRWHKLDKFRKQELKAFYHQLIK